MAYHPRIESPTLGSFLTTRCRNSELWFVNNKPLEDAILGYVAKFVIRYEVLLYSVAIEGNHIQMTAHFPKANRAAFMRDLNSCVARAVARLVPSYPGGRLFERRYSSEIVPGDEDIEEQFFYTVLQPVQDGLIPNIRKYKGYNSFHDAVYGIKRKFKVVNWAAYNLAKRSDPAAKIADFTEWVELKYTRLPGYEDMPREDYIKEMYRKFEGRRQQVVEERLKEGRGFAGQAALAKTKPGSRPKNTKKSTIDSHRPRVLCVCPKRRAEYKKWYFETYFAYKEASRRYRAGETDVTFPPGTYKPYLKVAVDSG